MGQKPISALEKKVMNIVWNKKSCSGRDVLQILQKERDFAYTTIATILQRLYEKGLVEKKKNGLGYIYSPKLSQKKYSTVVIRSFFNKMIDSFGDTAIASFAESIETLPKSKRERLLELIREYEEK